MLELIPSKVVQGGAPPENFELTCSSPEIVKGLLTIVTQV